MSKGNRSWDATHVVHLLSERRMKTYITAADADLDNAFELYAWNIELAAALQGTIAMVEVMVRNSIDRTLLAWVSRKRCGDWFDLAMLDEHAKSDIATARARIRRNGRLADHDRVVAELSFGFWRFLTTRRYHASLWVPVLHQAFPNGDSDLRVRQREVAHLLGNMNFIRNRAAHLEPLFRRDVCHDVAEARALMGWIDLDALEWFDATLTLDGVLETRPAFLDVS